MFGAALVEGRGEEPLILKASSDLQLAQEWAMGATMAARLRERGYPASDYVETGTTGEVTWSLQAVLPGRVPQVFTVGHAEQLIALARRHDTDAGDAQPWEELAREISLRALAEVGPLPDRFDEMLMSALDETADLAQSTIVHADFHHRNFLAVDDRVTGVFDWDIACPGDWRFDLVCLAFACQMYPKTCEPDALEVTIEAMHAHCNTPAAAFLTACQAVRALSMLRKRNPDWIEPASQRMHATFVQWCT